MLPRDSRLDPRRRRTRVCAIACFRRGVRQSRSARRVRVGDGEAETGPLATSWHSNKFLNPVRDGAVLPILHLNGYKIAGPTCSHVFPVTNWKPCFGLRLHAVFRRRRRPRQDAPTHGRDARYVTADIRRIQREARPTVQEAADWPMIIFRHPKGWTGPKLVDGKKTEGSWRSHQVPMGDMSHPGHVKFWKNG